tara:strand:- start:1444 stop:1818 length:375 start_codon:yes stop_codon:yes gene_type:complete
MPRFKSEAVVTAQCDAGVAQYLADMHMERLSHNIRNGVILGTSLSAALYLIGKKRFNLENWEVAMPFGLVIFTTLFDTLITWTKEDEDHTEAFDLVCFTEEEDESEEDEFDEDLDDVDEDEDME